jgi:hypothetical protein
MFASTTTLQMSTVAINVSTTHLASCNQREYDPPMCASMDPDVCKQLHVRRGEQIFPASAATSQKALASQWACHGTGPYHCKKLSPCQARHELTDHAGDWETHARSSLHRPRRQPGRPLPPIRHARRPDSPHPASAPAVLTILDSPTLAALPAAPKQAPVHSFKLTLNSR